MRLLQILLPISLGFISVFQTTLNRYVGARVGLSVAVLINGIVVSVVAIALLLLARKLPADWFGFLFVHEPEFEWNWWYLLPGIFGFLIILGLPFSLSKLPTLSVFVFFVAAQIVGSVVWDIFVNGATTSILKTAGAAFCILGAFLVSL